MPDAADQEHDHQAQIHADSRARVADERVIQVVAEPPGQRYMPAPRPEFTDRMGEIRPSEVFRKADTEQLRGTARHVGVAREVAIDLEGEKVGGDDQLQGNRIFRDRIDPVDEGREVVGHHDLFHQSPQEQLAPHGKMDRFHRGAAGQFSGEGGNAFDGAGQQLGEPCEVKHVLTNAGRHLGRCPVAVDQQGDGREGIKRKPGRGAQSGLRQPSHAFGKRRVIFQRAHQPQNRQDPSPKRQPPPGGVGLCQVSPRSQRDDRDRSQIGKVLDGETGVESQTGQQQPRQAQPCGQPPEQQDSDRQEQQEFKRCEQHAFPLCAARSPLVRRAARA